MVARGGIEPPTRGFSVRSRRFQELINQPLATLASPDPSLTQAQSRHTQSQFGTFLAHRVDSLDHGAGVFPPTGLCASFVARQNTSGKLW